MGEESLKNSRLLPSGPLKNGPEKVVCGSYFWCAIIQIQLNMVRVPSIIFSTRLI